MSRSLRDVFNEGNPNKVPAANQFVRMGELLNNIPQVFAGTPATPALAAAFGTNDALILPETRKAAYPIRGYKRVGGTPAWLIPQAVAPTVAVATTFMGVDGSGNLRVVTGVTDMEATYVPVEGPVIEDLVDVVGSAATLLQTRRAILLLEVEVLVGGTPGVKLITFRGQGAGVVGEVALDDTGAIVDFNAADVVAGTARIRYIAQPGEGTTPRSVGDELNADDKEF